MSFNKETFVYENMPVPIINKLSALALDLHVGIHIKRFYNEIVKYKQLGLIEYRVYSDGSVYYNPNKFSDRVKKYRKQFETLKPFLTCEDTAKDIYLHLPTPRKMTIRFEDRLESCGESVRTNKILDILLGRERKSKRHGNSDITLTKFLYNSKHSKYKIKRFK